MSLSVVRLCSIDFPPAMHPYLLWLVASSAIPFTVMSRRRHGRSLKVA